MEVVGVLMVQSEGKMTPNPHFYMKFSCDDFMWAFSQTIGRFGSPRILEFWQCCK